MTTISPTEPATRPAADDFAAWQRWVCLVGTALIVTGDLYPDRRRALEQLDWWLRSDAVGIIDCRGEWTDEDFVAVVAPELDYRYVGTDDDGCGQDNAWFEAGVSHFEDLAVRGGRVVVHCHMGINRGPSMAFAILLSQGWGITEALDALAEARPIVGLIYADDAVRWWGRRNGWSATQVAAGVAEVGQWQVENGIDVSQVIRAIRRAERSELA